MKDLLLDNSCLGEMILISSTKYHHFVVGKRKTTIFRCHVLLVRHNYHPVIVDVPGPLNLPPSNENDSPTFIEFDGLKVYPHAANDTLVLMAEATAIHPVNPTD